MLRFFTGQALLQFALALPLPPTLSLTPTLHRPCPPPLQRGYEVLCVSQFTLFGRLKGAGKPDFSKAMPPQQASCQPAPSWRRDWRAAQPRLGSCARC